MSDKNSDSKSHVKIENLNSETINDLNVLVGKELNHQNKFKSFLFRLSFKLQNLNRKNSEFFRKKPLLGYSIKRLLFSMFTFYIAIAIVYVMVSSVVNNTVLMQNYDMKDISNNGGIGSKWYLARVAEQKKILGLDKPLVIQVLNWWLNVSFFIKYSFVKGEYVKQWFNLGTVLSDKIANSGDDVKSLISSAMPNSFKIGFFGFLCAYIIGIPLGILCANYKNKAADKVINMTAIFIEAVPAIIIVSLIFVLAISSFGAKATYGSGGIETRVYPFLTMFILVLPSIVISVRRYVIDEMTSDYTKFAKSKGLKDGYIFTFHVFRVAGVRVLRIIPTALILSLFGSSILTETYWNVDGMGKLIIQAVTFRDIYLCLGYITMSALFGVVTSLIADLITAYLDPRVSLIS